MDNDLINYPHSGKLAYRLKNEGAKVRYFHLFIFPSLMTWCAVYEEDWLHTRMV